jgi:hypothetical protein
MQNIASSKCDMVFKHPVRITVSFVYVYFHFKGDLLSGLVSLDKIVALC